MSEKTLKPPSAREIFLDLALAVANRTVPVMRSGGVQISRQGRAIKISLPKQPQTQAK